MSSELERLCRQGKGRFAIPWLAATRGINKLKKKEIEGVNVAELCDDLQKLVLSESNKASQRISLRLSAKLMHGLVVIQNKKVSMLLDDTVNVLHSVEQPILEKPTQRKPKAHIVDVKEKHKKTKSALMDIVHEGEHVFTTEEIAAVLAEIPRASVESITLREEISPQVTRDESAFGDLGDIEAEVHVQKGFPILSKSRFQNIVDEVIKAQQPQPSSELEMKDVEFGISQRIPPNHEPPSVEISSIITAEPERPPTSVVVQPADADVSPVITPRKKRRIAKMDEKYFIQEETNLKSIRRKFDVNNELNKPKTFNPVNEDLIDPRDIDSNSMKKDVIIGEGDSERISLRLSRLRSIREGRSLTPEEPEPLRVTTVTSFDKQPLSMEVILERSQEALGQIIQPLPVVSTPVLVYEEVPIIAVERPSEEMQELILSPTDSTHRRKTTEERQQAILRIIQKWNFEEGELTIVHLCGLPITWISLTVIFEYLLYLSKRKYVNLVCHQSNELKCIEKASRLK